MSTEIRFDVRGKDQILNNFSTLAKKIQKELNIHALKAAAEPIMDAARDGAPVEVGAPGAGTLRDAIGMRTYSKGQWQHAIIGVRQGKRFVKIVGQVKRGKNKGKPIYKDPLRYMKALEFGGKHSAPRPFLRPAFDSQGGTKAVDRYIEDIKDGIAIEVSKLPKTV